MALEQLPKDPMMLLSVVNTKLRDKYSSLETLCEDMNVDEKGIKEVLKTIGYVYNSDLNRFI
ncbi:MAG: DUF4250 domain-containing protein [Lachnospiraceae bacterium]|nr:DUF4250 domain-containing protein [Lachnospiraceae bacterium]MBP3507848.1 DUF4250 domain-containing protein [Lachnospiraceae bacterium]